MTESFESRVERYGRIARRQEQYREGTGSIWATQFYIDQILEEVVDRARNRSDSPRRSVRLLISLAGFSPLTTILTYELVRPERLLVVSSEEAPDSIDVIAGHVVAPGRLRHREFRHLPCKSTDPLDIYRIVKDQLESMRGSGQERPFALIDITGGRKVMSAAAALAAWQLELDLCYVDSLYDPELRQPVVGSDRLLVLSNPTTLFGEQEMESARQTFLGGAFEAARRQYDELCESIAEPAKARFMRALSEVYRAWCDLDLAALPEAIDAVETTLVQARHELTSDTVSRVEDQLAFLRRLAHGDPTTLLVCFYLLGLHYRGLGRHDFAALLFYRTIEGCLSRRLEHLFPGFECERPDYALLGEDVAALRRDYALALAELGAWTENAVLPPVVGLVDAAVLLCVVGDRLPPAAHIKTPKALGHLRQLAQIRNRSVLAHGFETIGAERSETLQKKAHQVLRAFWSLNGFDEQVDELYRRLAFVRPER